MFAEICTKVFFTSPKTHFPTAFALYDEGDVEDYRLLGLFAHLSIHHPLLKHDIFPILQPKLTPDVMESFLVWDPAATLKKIDQDIAIWSYEHKELFLPIPLPESLPHILLSIL